MRVALIGSAGSVHLAPYESGKGFEEHKEGLPVWPPPAFQGEEWQIWGCSPGASGAVRRASRWFEVHRWEPGQAWLPQTYCQFLKNFAGPVYVGGPIPKEEIPNQVMYPLEEVETEFSSFFLTSSLSLMFALAILEIEAERKANPDHDWNEDVIAFFGVDMAASEEYGYQRAGCQHFILEAIKRGIGVYTPPESCLMRPLPVYGLSEWQHNYVKLTQRAREINRRRGEAAQAIEQNRMIMASCDGALEDLTYMTNTWTSPFGLPAGEVVRMKRDVVEKRSLSRSPDFMPSSKGEFVPSAVSPRNGNGKLRDTGSDRGHASDHAR
jgi:hypothetical protein